MTFVSRQQVRFAHIDAAGIVFYPRYFEMLNAAVEDLFADVVGTDFAAMHQRLGLGVPTVSLEAEFVLPSRLGEMLDFALDVTRIGRSSAHLSVDVTCDGAPRLRATVVLVCMALESARAHPWPDDFRMALEPVAA
ncbi:thioesterase superfamily protein [Sphingomonas sp. S17]|uniref:Acyl-CoA thioesterase n=2 Tax=Sphingomonas paucimobilis TaxID=13689 RepID=A0A411LL06_SPHPI|nr:MULTISPECIES: thioesterase family protein [Sphingomonas]EGI54717.1 thioesterase superfamily protein [Sphingomonas sp. S17]MBQ1481744.1 acyl-CoA thioesterase [Sphingomonas sp.]MCM3681534.1 acyl-CoA thioesterase [Sphingomonas paucimobilis]MDG5970223.1 acyl-CoA thioesterase [Sphingomonas paucimobilis]NNG56184.1 acyl-CoA thioesterase [Sphingomonas paucimobilis]